MNKQGLLYTVVFTFLVCFLFVFFLALTNEATRGKVAENERLFRQRAILSAMDISYANDDEVARLYSDIETLEIDGNTYYLGLSNNGIVYAKEFAGPGLWGTITGIIAVDENVTHSVGFEILGQNETPGLGGRIGERWFTEQFRNEMLVNGTIMVGKPGIGDTDSSNGSIDAVTGATRTSDAIGVILNNEIAILRETFAR